MTGIEEILADFVLAALWQIGLILAAALLVDRVLLSRTRAAVRHVHWVIASLLAILVPVFAVAATRGWIEPSPAVAVLIPAAIADSGALLSVALPESWSGTGEGLAAGVALGYVAYLLVALGAFVRSLLCLRRLTRSAGEPRNLPLLDETRQELGRRLSIPPPKVLLSDRIAAPVAVGCRRPFILLPSVLAKDADRPTLIAVLGHETAHLRRRDFPLNILLEALLLPILFHPAVWYLRAKVHLFRELACDETVADGLLERKAYARTLLRVAEGGFGKPVPPGQLAFGVDSLEKRIRSLAGVRELATSRLQSVRLGVAGLILAATGFAAVAACGEAPRSEPYMLAEPGVAAPVLIAQTVPRYTDEAIQAGHEGVGILSCVIRRNGRVTDCEIQRPVGYGLDESAIREIEENWRFRPGTLDGEPVDVRATVEVNFSLRKDPPDREEADRL